MVMVMMIQEAPFMEMQQVIKLLKSVENFPPPALGVSKPAVSLQDSAHVDGFYLLLGLANAD